MMLCCCLAAILPTNSWVNTGVSNNINQGPFRSKKSPDAALVPLVPHVFHWKGTCHTKWNLPLYT